MRRLYSTFAGGWPGIGLLVMRLVVGSVLLWGAASKPWGGEPVLALTSTSLAALGLLLLAGLWTPVVGIAAAALEVWQTLSLGEQPVRGLLTATIAAALAMLGPGRWSADARLFGWRRIETPARAHNPGVRPTSE